MQELPPTEDCWQTKSCPHHKAMLLLPLDNLRCELPGGCNRRVFVVKLSIRDAASHSSESRSHGSGHIVPLFDPTLEPRLYLSFNPADCARSKRDRPRK